MIEGRAIAPDRRGAGLDRPSGSDQRRADQSRLRCLARQVQDLVAHGIDHRPRDRLGASSLRQDLGEDLVMPGHVDDRLHRLLAQDPERRAAPLTRPPSLDVSTAHVVSNSAFPTPVAQKCRSLHGFVPPRDRSASPCAVSAFKPGNSPTVMALESPARLLRIIQNERLEHRRRRMKPRTQSAWKSDCALPADPLRAAASRSPRRLFTGPRSSGSDAPLIPGRALPATFPRAPWRPMAIPVAMSRERREVDQLPRAAGGTRRPEAACGNQGS